jgi:signal transduction histidine kinase
LKPLRILFIEDSDDDFLLVRAHLERAGFEVFAQRVETVADMRRALDESAWDLVLSDFTMPQFDGMAALSTLKESSQSEIPFIIVSGSIGEMRAVEALKAGAANYVMKGSLEKLVPVVEREIKDAEMRRERAEAYRALRLAVVARDEFLAIASHELKTPLTSLSLNVQSLRKAVKGKPGDGALPLEFVQTKVESVAHSTGRLAMLIDRLLDITRLTAGPLELILEDVDLSALVREVGARSQAALVEAGSTLSVRAPAGLVGRWDRERLDSVVSNLISNAIQYGSGKRIDVQVDDLGTEARLRVTDQGIGIPAEDQARIFNRFERAVPEHHYGGFGVGLWLAREIVAAHGGTIAVESAPGVGSTFTVALPKQRAAPR